LTSKQAVLSSESGDLDKTISLVKSGLGKKTIEETYKKLKNEGKCCEGGSEGWTG